MLASVLLRGRQIVKSIIDTCDDTSNDLDYDRMGRAASEASELNSEEEIRQSWKTRRERLSLTLEDSLARRIRLQ